MQNRVKPIHYVFKNGLKVTIPFLFFYVIFAFTPVELFDDFFEFKKIMSPTDFISTILGVIATIISITVAIIILSFETFKHKAGEYATEYFGSIKWLHYLVALYITSILLIFFSFIHISREGSDYVNLLYFNTYLFITTLGLLLVFSYKLFQSISVSELIAYYYSRLSVKDIIANRGQYGSPGSIKEALANPLFILEDLGLSYVRKGDFVAANFIYSKISDKIIEEIKGADDNDCRQYLNSLSKVYYNVIPEAIHQNNDVLLSEIWEWHYIIHSSLGIKRASVFWNYYSNFGCSYYKILVQNGKYDHSEEFFKSVSILFYNDDFEELFPDEKLILSFALYYQEEYINLYGKPEMLNENNYTDHAWEDFIKAYVTIYYTCGEFNLETNNERGLIAVIHSLSRHIKFSHTSSSAPLKSLYVYRVFYSIIRELLDRGIDRDIFRNDTDKILRDINPLTGIGLMDKVLYERLVLTEYCNLLIFLQRNGITSHYIFGGLTFGPMVLTGELGALAHRYLYGYKKDENMIGCLETIVEVFEVLKEDLERDLTSGKSQGLHFQLRERLKEISIRLSTSQTTDVRLTQMNRKLNTLIRIMTRIRKDKGIE